MVLIILKKPHAGLYNIWYSRNTDYLTFQERREAKLAGPTYRVELSKDTGFTKAKEGAYHCIYFSHGKCYRGAECVYFHRIPLQIDENHSDSMKDVFGRERFATDREDMGGVGSFHRESRTLFISGLKNLPNLDEILYKHFSEFGEITYLKVVEEKTISFVQYRLRCCAEFAKEAMTDQALDEDEILNVRWASEDPKTGSFEEQEANPAKKSEEEKRFQAWEKMKSTNPQYFAHYETLHVDGEYPNTDSQYERQNVETKNEAPRQTKLSEKEKEYYASYSQSVSQALPNQAFQSGVDPAYMNYYQQYANYYQQLYSQYYPQQQDDVREPDPKKKGELSES